MRVLELYSGIGGMHYALKESTVNGTVAVAMDINTIANKVYKHNFPTTTNSNGNIEFLTVEEITKLDVDCILMSPPCQPFTRVGLKKDLYDNRCSSLLHILTIIPHLKNLKYILLENVKGFESSQVRDNVISCLEKGKFNYQEFILSPCQFGIPNSRHRYYLIAKRKKLKFIFDNSELLTSLPEKVLKILPEKTYKSLPVTSRSFNFNNKENCYKIKHVLEDRVDEKYLISENILVKRGTILDIRSPESNGSCCFTKAYNRYIEGTGSVLSPYSDIEIKKTFEQLNNSKMLPEEKSKYLLNLRLRFFTPKEISRLMSFPEDFEFPNDLTDKQKYRLLGNSINVYVISKLIYLLHYESDL